MLDLAVARSCGPEPTLQCLRLDAIDLRSEQLSYVLQRRGLIRVAFNKRIARDTDAI